MTPSDTIDSENFVPENGSNESAGAPDPILTIPDRDVDLGCGGCTHWLAIDNDSEG